MNYKTALETTALLTLGIVLGITLSNAYHLNKLGMIAYEQAELGTAHEHYPFPPNQEVTFNGTIQKGDYTIHIQNPESNDDLGNGTLAYTYPGGNKEIWISNNRSAKSIEESCDHEVFHELFPKFEHPNGFQMFLDPVYRFSDDANIWQCDQAVKTALEKQ